MLERDPGLAPIRESPEFRELVRELALRWIELARKRGYHTQPELRMQGMAHLARGELEQAVDAFEPRSRPAVRRAAWCAELDQARARLAQERAGAGRPDGAQAD